jgi:hypothetical protein
VLHFNRRNLTDELYSLASPEERADAIQEKLLEVREAHQQEIRDRYV